MRLATLFVFLYLLTACGQKGPLYLPGSSKTQEPAPVAQQTPEQDELQVGESPKKPQEK